jgi:hypothetical protein
MFDTDFLTPLKGYYPFKFFGELYRMGTYVRAEYTESPLYCVAAKSEEGAGIMLTNFSEDDTASTVTAVLNCKGMEGRRVSVYTLDETNDAALTDTFTASEEITVHIPLYSVIYLKFE